MAVPFSPQALRKSIASIGPSRSACTRPNASVAAVSPSSGSAGAIGPGTGAAAGGVRSANRRPVSRTQIQTIASVSRPIGRPASETSSSPSVTSAVPVR